MRVIRSGETVHLMSLLDVVLVRHAIEDRNESELKLYTTDDLRRLYQGSGDELIRLRDGIVTRPEMVAEIRWRILCGQVGYVVLFIMTVIAAIAAVVAAVEGWK